MGDRVGASPSWAGGFETNRSPRIPERGHTWRLETRRKERWGVILDHRAPWVAGSIPVLGQGITGLASTRHLVGHEFQCVLRDASCGVGFMQRARGRQRPICLLGHFVESTTALDFSFKSSPLHSTFCSPKAAAQPSGGSPRTLAVRRLDHKTVFFFFKSFIMWAFIDNVRWECFSLALTKWEWRWWIPGKGVCRTIHLTKTFAKCIDLTANNLANPTPTPLGFAFRVSWEIFQQKMVT